MTGLSRTPAIPDGRKSSRIIGIIGAGAIASELFSALAKHLDDPFESVVFLARSGSESRPHAIAEQYSGVAKRFSVACNLEDFICENPGLVVECAGQRALAETAERLLRADIDVIGASIGALADRGFRERLYNAQRESTARLILPSGAVGGLDLLSAAGLAGIERLTYTGRKPPRAWLGTPAEAVVDLDKLASSYLIYEGNAENAARAFPKNANAALAIGFSAAALDRMVVRLVADPEATGNVHQIRLESRVATMNVEVRALPSQQNPKTSAIVGFSIANEILKAGRWLRRDPL